MDFKTILLNRRERFSLDEIGDITLISIEYSPMLDGVRDVIIKGFSPVKSILIILKIEDEDPEENKIETLGQGYFSIKLKIKSKAPYEICMIESKGPKNSAKGEKVTVIFNDMKETNFQKGNVAKFSDSRLGYAAGNADRIQFSKTFIKLEPRPAIKLLDLFSSTLNFTPDKTDNIGIFDRGFFLESLKVKADNIQKNNNNKDYFNALKGIANGIKAQDFFKTNNSGEQIRYAKHKGRGKSPANITAGKNSMALGYNDIQNTIVRDWHRFLEQTKAYARIGYIFNERIRYRPTNLVIGEPFYQLALYPGEEVQLRQSTETKQKTTLSDLKESESEKTNSFSSSWSNDSSSVINTQDTFQQSTHLGLDAGLNIPEIPINIGVGIANDISEAHTVSAQYSVNSKIEKTINNFSKLRSQHKIQLEITNESSNSFSSTRTVKNQNQLRSVHNIFYKVYRKEQITLERYNSQLCFRFVVKDPAEETRKAFITALLKIDPANPDLYNVVKPTTKVKGTVFSLTFDAPPFSDPMFRDTIQNRWVSKAFDIYALAKPVGGGGKLKLISAKFKLKRLEHFHTDPLISPEPANYDISPHQLSNRQDHFLYIPNEYTGDVRWKKSIVLGVRNTDCELAFNLKKYNESPVRILNSGYSAYTKAVFEVETEWEKLGALEAYLEACMEAKKNLIEELRSNSGKIEELHSIAERAYPDSVIDRALKENLTYHQGFDVFQINQILDFQGISFENIPYWAHDFSRDNVYDLKNRLEKLPINIQINNILTDSLTASEAVVYIPIKEGKESEALDLLSETRPYSEEIVTNLNDYREANFKLRKNNLPTVDQLLSPDSPVITSTGDPAWKKDWEKPQKEFLILGQWSDLVPTDGVHVETILSNTVVADESENARLIKINSNV